MSQTYPIPTFNYRVRIAGKVLAFSEVSGLTVQHDEVVYRHGLSFQNGYHIRRGFAKPINITLKNGMIASDITDSEARQFLRESFFKDRKHDIEIDLCNEAGMALITWKVIGAVPLKFELPSLQANSNEVAVESVELLARELSIA